MYLHTEETVQLVLAAVQPETCQMAHQQKDLPQVVGLEIIHIHLLTEDQVPCLNLQQQDLSDLKAGLNHLLAIRQNKIRLLQSLSL
jgi:hypothetical protein